MLSLVLHFNTSLCFLLCLSVPPLVSPCCCCCVFSCLLSLSLSLSLCLSLSVALCLYLLHLWFCVSLFLVPLKKDILPSYLTVWEYLWSFATLKLPGVSKAVRSPSLCLFFTSRSLPLLMLSLSLWPSLHCVPVSPVSLCLPSVDVSLSTVCPFHLIMCLSAIR